MTDTNKTIDEIITDFDKEFTGHSDRIGTMLTFLEQSLLTIQRQEREQYKEEIQDMRWEHNEQIEILSK